MSSWRDDLPPIPTERIRAEAIREGTRRRENRQRRQRNALLGGLGAAAVALVVVSGVLTGPNRDDQDAATADTSADATAATEVPAATEPPAEDTIPATDAPAGTEAPAATEPAGTSPDAASETTAAVVDYTTIGGTNAQLPPSGDVTVVPAEIFEQPPTGPTCGPPTLDVTFRPQGQAPRAPIVHWETSGVTGEAPMVIDGDVARATIGPFPPETLDEGVSYEVLVYVTDIDASGATQVFRSPPVVLRDCSP
jgi:hypothetical protein